MNIGFIKNIITCVKIKVTRKDKLDEKRIKKNKKKISPK